MTGNAVVNGLFVLPLNESALWCWTNPSGTDIVCMSVDHGIRPVGAFSTSVSCHFPRQGCFGFSCRRSLTALSLMFGGMITAFNTVLAELQ